MSKIRITPKYIIVPRDLLRPNYVAGIKKYFELRHQTRFGPPQVFKLYKESNTIMLFPKGSIQLVIAEILKPGSEQHIIIDDVVDNLGKCINYIKYIKKECIDGNQVKIIDYLRANYFNVEIAKTNIAGCVLVAPPGIGKTRIAVVTALSCGYKILYITSNKSLMEQAANEIRGITSNSDKIKITFIGDGKCDNSGDIVIAIINSIISCDRTILSVFGFTIIDEAHGYCSDKFGEVFWKTQSMYTLAMTASPDERADKFDKAIPIHIGPIFDAVHMKEYDPCDITYKCQVTIVKYHGAAEYTQTKLVESTGMICHDAMIKQFQTDPVRLQLLINIITQLYNAGRHIFVFVEQRSFCETIRDTLSKIDLDIQMDTNESNADFFVLMGGSKKTTIAQASEKRSVSGGTIILTTYCYSGKGTSIPKMDTLIMGTPRKSNMKQICGRIFRRGGDETIIRQIIDIVDVATYVKKQAVERNKYYTAAGYATKIIDV